MEKREKKRKWEGKVGVKGREEWGDRGERRGDGRIEWKKGRDGRIEWKQGRMMGG